MTENNINTILSEMIFSTPLPGESYESSYAELSAALTGATAMAGDALAQLKQSNPPVASSRLVAVSAVYCRRRSRSCFCRRYAARRSENGLFISPPPN